jgi:hypothetical protein
MRAQRPDGPTETPSKRTVPLRRAPPLRSAMPGRPGRIIGGVVVVSCVAAAAAAAVAAVGAGAGATSAPPGAAAGPKRTLVLVDNDAGCAAYSRLIRSLTGTSHRPVRQRPWSCRRCHRWCLPRQPPRSSAHNPSARADRGHDVAVRLATDATTTLSSYGEWLYDNLLILAPEAECA